MQPQSRFAISVIVCFCFLSTAQALHAQELPASNPVEAIGNGKLILNLRPRYEHVEQDGKPENADAFTMRTLLGWRTGKWQGLSVYIEGINVGHLGPQRYNDDPARTSPYPLVADPDSGDVNQMYADYTGIPGTTVRAGRQSIKLDNVRYIGNVEFRQVMQVFNAVTVENVSLPNTRLYAGYLMRQKTVFDTQRDINEPIFNARYTWMPNNALVAFAYLQDQANTGQATGFADNSNKIVGLRADGLYPVSGPWGLLYTAEYAKQDSYSGGDPRIDADYYHIALGVQWKDMFLRIDQEKLGTNQGVYAFQTPLGTNHLFQGWADLFLTTPRQGIRDTYVAAGAKLHKATLYGEYHRYRSDLGNIDYGSEIDLAVSYPFLKSLTGKIELADYHAGDAISGKVDTRKIWLTLIYSY
jgi:hypothetical protein